MIEKLRVFVNPDLQALKERAEEGNSDAQYWLAHEYFKGENIPENRAKALMWFSLSANGGNQSARRCVESLRRFMKPQDIAEAERLARDWKARKPER